MTFDDTQEKARQTAHEISVEDAARLLGITPRSVLNYLQSRQIEGVKVGKKWSIKRDSVLALKGKQAPTGELPPIEEPKSKSQMQKTGHSWSHQKPMTKGILKLSAFSRVREAYQIFVARESEIADISARTYIRGEWLALSDDLGMGFYTYGTSKLQLYNRARLRVGKLVSRLLMENAPTPMQQAALEAAESIAAICRKLSKGQPGNHNPSAKEPAKEGPQSHER